MQNNVGSETRIRIKTDCFTPIDWVKVSYETLYVNNDCISLVNKEKLLKKSHYFKSKTCTSCSLSDIFKFNIPVSIKSFQKVFDYINTDSTTITDDTVFEMLKITEVLQIKCLYNKCLNHYVKKLTCTKFDNEQLDQNIDVTQTDKNMKSKIIVSQTKVLKEEDTLNVRLNKENVIKVKKRICLTNRTTSKQLLRTVMQTIKINLLK